MKAWKAELSLFRFGDSSPLRSALGDCTGNLCSSRASLQRQCWPYLGYMGKVPTVLTRQGKAGKIVSQPAR